MGFYLNPDNKGFWKAVRSKIYVDKTGLIACTNELINTEQQYLCVSRPRRFGKSMALKMLAAYYSRAYDGTCKRASAYLVHAADIAAAAFYKFSFVFQFIHIAKRRMQNQVGKLPDAHSLFRTKI